MCNLTFLKVSRDAAGVNVPSDGVGDVNKDLLGMLSVPKGSRDLSERDLGA